ncbi:MAG: efflux RND transporter periplasmic adaptor subunit, partial [Bdellovibrionota bacterium]
MNKKILIPVAILAAVVVILKFFVFKGEFLYAGTLEATKVDLSAKLSSTISAVNVHEGDHVQANQDLVNLTCDDVKVSADLANSNYQRNLRLLRSGTVSQDTMDQIKNRKDEMDVRQSWCKIVSPIQGTVLSRYHEPGEWVNPGTKLLTLANIQDIWAYIYVPQPEVSRLKPGMTLKAFLPELANREFEGKILKINEEAEFTPKNVQTRAER